MSGSNDPSSPFSYPPSQTALLLLDFQNFTINLCGELGEAALTKAITLRQWALEQNILVVHSIVDINGTPPSDMKNSSRVRDMLASIKSDPGSGNEPPSLTLQRGEHILYKQPGVVSGLKSSGCRELLEQRGIKSLIICGLSTSGAVLRTAVPATDDGFVVGVVRDACADRTVELHEVLMEKVLPSRAWVLTGEEFVQGWKRVQGEDA